MSEEAKKEPSQVEIEDRMKSWLPGALIVTTIVLGILGFVIVTNENEGYLRALYNKP